LLRHVKLYLELPGPSPGFSVLSGYAQGEPSGGRLRPAKPREVLPAVAVVPALSLTPVPGVPRWPGGRAAGVVRLRAG